VPQADFRGHLKKLDFHTSFSLSPGWLEEACTHIQAGRRHTDECNKSKAANYGDQIHNQVGLRFGNGARGNFWNSMHFAL
jgi:hypothetical protein